MDLLILCMVEHLRHMKLSPSLKKVPLTKPYRYDTQLDLLVKVNILLVPGVRDGTVV